MPEVWPSFKLRQSSAAAECKFLDNYTPIVLLMFLGTADPDIEHIESVLANAYGGPVSAAEKMNGLRVVANALNAGEIAKAQIGMLLLQLPDPPNGKIEPEQHSRPAKRMGEFGWLLKDWDSDKHPRAGAPPNPGWFAPAGGDMAPTGSDRRANVISICIAEGISIATDQYGNQISTCYYTCFGGGSFTRNLRGGVGCGPVIKPPFLN